MGGEGEVAQSHAAEDEDVARAGGAVGAGWESHGRAAVQSRTGVACGHSPGRCCGRGGQGVLAVPVVGDPARTGWGGQVAAQLPRAGARLAVAYDRAADGHDSPVGACGTRVDVSGAVDGAGLQRVAAGGEVGAPHPWRARLPRPAIDAALEGHAAFAGGQDDLGVGVGRLRSRPLDDPCVRRGRVDDDRPAQRQGVGDAGPVDRADQQGVQAVGELDAIRALAWCPLPAVERTLEPCVGLIAVKRPGHLRARDVVRRRIGAQPRLRRRGRHRPRSRRHRAEVACLIDGTYLEAALAVAEVVHLVRARARRPCPAIDAAGVRRHTGPARIGRGEGELRGPGR